MPGVRPFDHQLPLEVYGPRQTMSTVSDPLEERWSYLQALALKPMFVDFARKVHGVKAGEASKSWETARSYVIQAHDYFYAARSANPRSSPLLYYYSMLNLSKFLLAISGPRRLKGRAQLNHGLTVPRDARTLRTAVLRSRPGIFTSLTEVLTGETMAEQDLQLRDLVARCLDITFEYEAAWRKPSGLLQCDISRRTQAEKRRMWLTVTVQVDSNQNASTLAWTDGPLGGRFKLRQSPGNSIVFESSMLRWKGHGYTKKLSQLRRMARPLRVHLLATSSPGYIYYLPLPMTGKAAPLPELANILAVAFYLSHIVRYRPYVFERAISAPDSWILTTFNRSCTTKFISLALDYAIGKDMLMAQS
jgi:hypothetical protein